MSRPVRIFAFIAAALAALIGLAAGALAQTEEKRVALVIGEASYKNVTPLAHTANDARLIAGALRSLGFRLIGNGALVDLDKSHLEQAIRDFSRALSGHEAALFYYAGHGVQMQGANYLVPISANPQSASDADFELVDVALVLRQMDAAGARLNIVILDACRNNPFGGRGLRDIGGGLAQMKAPKGTLISYATQPGNVASDGSGDDSPYSLALAEALRKPGEDVFQLFNEVGITVDKATNGEQQPWLASSPIEGDFFFSGGPTAATAPRSAVDREALFWESIKTSNDPADFRAYLKQYPKGTFAVLAQNRISDLARSPVPAAAAAAAPAAPSQAAPPAAPPSTASTRSSEAAPQVAMTVPAPAPSPPANAPEDTGPVSRVRGTVERLDGDRLLVRTANGSTLSIAMAPQALVRAIIARGVDTVGVGDAVGAATVLGPSGNDRALELHVFPAAATINEGRFAWDLAPASEMVIAHVVAVQRLPQGTLFRVRLKAEEARIFVPDATPVVSWQRGNRGLLKPGAAVFVLVHRSKDGGLETSNVAVERGGVKPPM